MGAIQTELSDKVRQKDVDYIVHKKYEDIVQYLQDALRASEGEEESFAKRAEDLEERLQKVAASKADRLEVAPMMEIVVKTEAMLAKMNQSNKDKEKMKDMFSKKEIEALLELKVDKVEYEERMKEALKMARKSKKLTVMNGGLPAIDDNSTFMSMSSAQSSLAANSNMWKGLAEGFKEESKQAVYQNSSESPEDNMQKQQQMIQQQLQLVQQQQNLLLSQLQQAGGGDATHIKQQLQDVQQMHIHLTTQLQVVQQNQSNASRTGGNSVMTLSVTGSANDFSTFAKGVKKANAKSAAGNLPSNTNPGAFKQATEGGVAGGDVIPPNVMHAIDNAVELQYYPNVPPDSRPGHDMSFLGGPYAGGGFNLRQQKLGTQQLRPMGMVPVEPVDVEGTGL
jgi:molybdopterin-biosynthesis enzyme MoeA-like protein